MTELPTPDFSRLAPAAGTSILVIGGYGGIGYSLVEHAITLGLTVTVMDLPGAASRRGLEDSGQFIPVDLRDEVSIESAFSLLEKTGVHFDSVAMCSGYTRGHDRIDELNTDRFDDVLSGNLRGPILALRSVCRLLTDDASVVLLSTAMGQLGAPGYAGYGVAKAGLNAAIRILAAELAPGIRVNGVAPGAVDTAFIRGGYDEGGTEDGAPVRFNADEYNSKVPLKRMGVSEDVVGPILFLLSESARYITGQVLHVNGGAFMRD